MSTVNIPLLVKTMEFIEQNPERHYQEYWNSNVLDQETGCSTAFCFAGWAAIFSGAEVPNWSEVGMFWGVTADLRSVSVNKDSTATHIAHYAEQVLGLEPLDALDLFSPFQTKEGQREIVDRIVNENKEVAA